MQRPQEALNVHAIDAMVQTLNAIESSPLTGSPIALVAMTGDSIDNTQRNELDNFLALFDGGTVRPGFRRAWVRGRAGGRLARRHLLETRRPARGGFVPARPRLSAGARPARARDAAARGDRHETPLAWVLRKPRRGLPGRRRRHARPAHAMAGSRKPIALPEGLDRETALETFVKRPEYFMTGASLEVTPDASRRPITRMEFVEAHHGSGRHGFTDRNRTDGTAYYVHDTPLGPIHHARHRLCRRVGPTGASTRLSCTGWNEGSRRCTRRSGRETGPRCARSTTTVSWWCCRITATTCWPTRGRRKATMRCSSCCCDSGTWCSGSTATFTPTGSRRV